MKQAFGKSHVPLSPAMRAGDFVFVSGQVPTDADGRVVPGDVREQTRQVLENLSGALALADCTLADVIKTTVWLRDAEDFAAFNEVYGQAFADAPPTRTTVQSRLMIDIALEIEAIAYKPL